MNPLEAEEAELFAAILEGRVPPDEERARALFRRRPELQRLRAAYQDVDQEPDMAALETSEDDRRMVAEYLAVARHEVKPEPPARRPAPVGRRWALVALAAAALVLLLLRLRTGDGDAGQQGKVTLGSRSGTATDELKCVSPVGSTASFHSFSWTYDRPLGPREKFHLQIWAQATPGTRGELLDQGLTTLPHLEFSEDKVAGWPHSILWSVEVMDTRGLAGSSAEASAQLSR